MQQASQFCTLFSQELEIIPRDSKLELGTKSLTPHIKTDNESDQSEYMEHTESMLLAYGRCACGNVGMCS